MPRNALVRGEGSLGSCATYALEAQFLPQECRSKPQKREIFISAFQHCNQLTLSDFFRLPRETLL